MDPREVFSPALHNQVRTVLDSFLAEHRSSDDAALAEGLVRTAGQMAHRLREQGLTVEYKTSISDVVTEADKASEYFVATALQALRPNDGLLGEEGAQAAADSGRTWVIDPVDGTYNFTNFSDYWCSALALVEGDPHDPTDLLIGAVHRPVPSQTWVKAPGKATLRNGKPLPALTAAAAGTVSIGTYLHPTFMQRPEFLTPWSKVVAEFACLRIAGAASVDLAGIAEGRLGGWMQHSVNDWDWLPGRALVEGVGGTTGEVTVGPVTWKVAGNEQTVATMVHVLQAAAAQVS
ncbi:inositol monophosphatase family protein [Corynebacterium choanae]|nr:inositol monophosphatase family protein [Corynebacterium choanae]